MTLEIQRADSVRHAAAILSAEDTAHYLGGGTLLMRDVNSGHPSIQMLVLSDGLDLDRIEIEDQRVTLGSAVTMTKIAEHPALEFLRSAAESIGGPAVRAMATVGGNLFAPNPYGDFAVALLALDSLVTVEDLEAVKTIELETLLAEREHGHRRIVRSVAFDKPAARAFHFVKVTRRHPHGASVLSIAVCLPHVDGKVSGARIAYGAMASAPIRARAVEAALEGRSLDASAIAAAAAAATDACAPENDAIASAWYRLQILPVYLRRLLTQLQH